MISKSIKNIGIEFECGFSNQDDVATDFDEQLLFPSRVNFKRDSSVYVGQNAQHEELDHNCAEITYHSSSKTDLNKFLKILYETGEAGTNSSCGFHLHVEFADEKKKEWLALLSTKGFQHAFIREYKKKFKDKSKYINRLQYRFCKANYNELSAINGLRGNANRYKAINLNPFVNRKTIEFRLMPYQENFTEAKNTINWFVKTLEKIKKEKRLLASKDVWYNRATLLKDEVEVYKPAVIPIVNNIEITKLPFNIEERIISIQTI